MGDILTGPSIWWQRSAMPQIENLNRWSAPLQISSLTVLRSSEWTLSAWNSVGVTWETEKESDILMRFPFVKNSYLWRFLGKHVILYQEKMRKSKFCMKLWWSYRRNREFDILMKFHFVKNTYLWRSWGKCVILYQEKMRKSKFCMALCWYYRRNRGSSTFQLGFISLWFYVYGYAGENTSFCI